MAPRRSSRAQVSTPRPRLAQEGRRSACDRRQHASRRRRAECHPGRSRSDAVFRFVELYLMAFFWLAAALPLKPCVVGLFPPRLRAEAADVIAELGRKVGGHA